MRIVNRYYVSVLIGPIDDGAEIDYPPIESMDSDDESQVQQLIRTLIVPFFNRVDPESQATMKLTLAYYLKTNPTVLVANLESTQTPMLWPKDGEIFFRVLWHELFPAEDVVGFDTSDCVEMDDANSTHWIRTAR